MQCNTEKDCKAVLNMKFKAALEIQRDFYINIYNWCASWQMDGFRNTSVLD